MRRVSLDSPSWRRFCVCLQACFSLSAVRMVVFGQLLMECPRFPSWDCVFAWSHGWWPRRVGRGVLDEHEKIEGGFVSISGEYSWMWGSPPAKPDSAPASCTNPACIKCSSRNFTPTRHKLISVSDMYRRHACHGWRKVDGIYKQ